MATESLPEVPIPVFSGVEDVSTRLNQVGYLADDRVATTVFLATTLGRPILLEGPAGIGKTDLARSLSKALDRRLVRLQCYESQDESKALYEWDYGKQLLYTQILREKISEVVGDAADLAEATDLIAEHDDVFFSDRFLSERPLLAAMRSPEPVVLLIDEIDRSDEALEAVMLETLEENQISIPEIGTVKAAHPPLVIITSNNTRDLSAALKRRCLHLFLGYPDAERELAIVQSKKTGLAEALERELVDVVQELRTLELRKAPSIAETVDWARTLAVLGVDQIDLDNLSATANIVMKYERDLERALAHLTQRYGVETPAAGAKTPTPAPAPAAAPAPSQVREAPQREAVTVEEAEQRRAIRDAYDTPGRHGAAAFFGGRGSADVKPGNRRRPV